MKKIIILILLVVAGTWLSAQQSEKAKQILDEVSKKTLSYSSITADFSYSMENKQEGIDEGYTGTILLKGEKYNVHITKIGLKMISDGKTIWNYMEDANEVTISTVDKENTELMDPSKIFTIYEHGFTYNFIGEKTEEGKSLYLIDLIPDSEGKDFSKISISVNKATMMIHSALMFDKSGTQFRIKVIKMELNKPVADSHFTFDTSKYKDIEIIDFR